MLRKLLWTYLGNKLPHSSYAFARWSRASGWSPVESRDSTPSDFNLVQNPICSDGIVCNKMAGSVRLCGFEKHIQTLDELSKDNFLPPIDRQAYVDMYAKLLNRDASSINPEVQSISNCNLFAIKTFLVATDNSVKGAYVQSVVAVSLLSPLDDTPSRPLNILAHPVATFDQMSQCSNVSSRLAALNGCSQVLPMFADQKVLINNRSFCLAFLKINNDTGQLTAIIPGEPPMFASIHQPGYASFLRQLFVDSGFEVSDEFLTYDQVEKLHNTDQLMGAIGMDEDFNVFTVKQLKTYKHSNIKSCLKLPDCSFVAQKVKFKLYDSKFSDDLVLEL